MHVHLVFARPKTDPWDLELLGVFEDNARARAFIDRIPVPQRECLEVHTWPLNQHSADPFWTGGPDRPELAEAARRRLEAYSIGLIMKDGGVPEYFIAQLVDLAGGFEGIADLLRTWRSESDQFERDAIIADLQDFISDFGFGRP